MGGPARRGVPVKRLTHGARGGCQRILHLRSVVTARRRHPAVHNSARDRARMAVSRPRQVIRRKISAGTRSDAGRELPRNFPRAGQGPCDARRGVLGLSRQLAPDPWPAHHSATAEPRPLPRTARPIQGVATAFAPTTAISPNQLNLLAFDRTAVRCFDK
jgi:hypothetical protein